MDTGPATPSSRPGHGAGRDRAWNVMRACEPPSLSGSQAAGHARQQALQGLVQRGVDDIERRINVYLVAVPIRFWCARLEAGGLVPPGQFATGLMETGLDLLAGELAFLELKEEWRIVETGILPPAQLGPYFLLAIEQFAIAKISGLP